MQHCNQEAKLEKLLPHLSVFSMEQYRVRVKDLWRTRKSLTDEGGTERKYPLGLRERTGGTGLGCENYSIMSQSRAKRLYISPGPPVRSQQRHLRKILAKHIQERGLQMEAAGFGIQPCMRASWARRAWVLDCSCLTRMQFTGYAASLVWETIFLPIEACQVKPL